MTQPFNRARLYGQLHNGDGQHLWTLQGYPFKGKPPSMALRKEELEEKVVHLFTFRSDVFELPRDKERHDKVMEAHFNNALVLTQEPKPIWVPEKGCYVVLLTWIEPYGVLPPAPEFDLEAPH